MKRQKQAFKTIQEKIVHNWPIGLTEKQLIKVRKDGLTPAIMRAFIDNYGRGDITDPEKWIRSDDWERLKSLLEDKPSLQLVGDVESGKTFLASLLIRHDSEHVFIVLDAHNEFSFLPEVNTITHDLTGSCRIKLPDQPAGAVGMFSVYYNLIMNQIFPKHYILVVEEALRYKDTGIKNLLAEARKFIKVLAVSQEQLVDFVPDVKVVPYKL